MQYGNIKEYYDGNPWTDEPGHPLRTPEADGTCACFMDYYNRNFGFCPINSFDPEPLHLSPSELAGLPHHADHHGQSRVQRHRQNGDGHNYPIRTVMDRNERSQMDTRREPNLRSGVFDTTKSVGHSVGQRQRQRPKRKKRVKFWGDFTGAKKPPPRKIAIFTKNSRVGECAKISYV
jgi:hypothetical protein